MKKGQRQALLRNQVADLILHGSLTTTQARAKTLKREVERFISRVKEGDLTTYRRTLAFLPKEKAVQKLFEQIIPQFKGRTGGFVRLIKLPPRRGDHAMMARIEFIEEIKEKETEEKKEAKPGKAKKTKPKTKKKDDQKDKGNKKKRS